MSEPARCVIDGCNRAQARFAKYCPAHFARYRKHGDPLHGGPIRTWTPRLERLPSGTELTDAEKARRRRSTILIARYGITIEEYDVLAKAQGHRCALCGLHERFNRNPNGMAYMAVDHDHETGEIRGLLCTGCNLLLGRIEKIGIPQIAGYFGLGPSTK